MRVDQASRKQHAGLHQKPKVFMLTNRRIEPIVIMEVVREPESATGARVALLVFVNLRPVTHTEGCLGSSCINADSIEHNGNTVVQDSQRDAVTRYWWLTCSVTISGNLEYTGSTR